ncbi:MAG: hypothetical protein M3R06_01105 [Chloroflexota bacterium]|nr:hypothetical protein [Chloroflexota bacterium]
MAPSDWTVFSAVFAALLSLITLTLCPEEGGRTSFELTRTGDPAACAAAIAVHGRDWRKILHRELPRYRASRETIL